MAPARTGAIFIYFFAFNCCHSMCYHVYLNHKEAIINQRVGGQKKWQEKSFGW